MKRALAILLVLLFGLGPLTATVHAEEDSRLPPCCRRHGTHHCAMSDAFPARMAQESRDKPLFTAPSHCPFYPTGKSATVASKHALTVASLGVRCALQQPLAPSAYRAAFSIVPLRTRAGRSPPLPAIG